MRHCCVALLVLIAVCTGTKGYGENGFQKQGQSQNQSNPPYNPSSINAQNSAVKGNPPSPNNPPRNEPVRVTVENIRDAASRKDGWDYASFCLQALLAMLAIIGGCWAYRTLKATEIAAYAARDANERAMKADRAWLTVTNTELVGNKPGEQGTVYVQCAVKNIGKSYARVLGMKAILRVGPIGEPEKSRDESRLQRDITWTHKWTIFPDKTTALHSPVPEVNGTAGDRLITSAEQGETQFIHGAVYYWDAFTETVRITTFCFRNSEIDQFGKHATGFHPIGAPEFNHQT
jgi:hypothetical protein